MSDLFHLLYVSVSGCILGIEIVSFGCSLYEKCHTPACVLTHDLVYLHVHVYLQH